MNILSVKYLCQFKNLSLQSSVPAVPSRHYVGRTGYHIYGWSAHQCRMLLGYTKLVKHQMGIL